MGTVREMEEMVGEELVTSIFKYLRHDKTDLDSWKKSDRIELAQLLAGVHDHTKLCGFRYIGHS